MMLAMQEQPIVLLPFLFLALIFARALRAQWILFEQCGRDPLVRKV